MILYVAKISYQSDNWFGNCQGGPKFYTDTHSHTHTHRHTHRHTNTQTHTGCPFYVFSFSKKKQDKNQFLENFREISLVGSLKGKQVNKFSHSYYTHYQSVLPKGWSFTASAGTQAVVLPKAGLAPQTQEPRLRFYQGLDRCGSFPLLSTPTIVSILFTNSLVKNPEVHYRPYTISPSIPILSKIYPVLSITTISLKTILILSSHLLLSLPKGLFPLMASPLKLSMRLWIFQYVLHVLPISLVSIMLGNEYNACNSVLRKFLHSPAISSLLAPNIFLSNLLSNTSSLFSSLKVRDQVSQPYNTTGNVG